MREAAVAIEKKAVERAILPACRPGAGSAAGSSPGSKASASRTAMSSARAASSSALREGLPAGASGVWGGRGLAKRGEPSVAIVGGRPEPGRCPLVGIQTMANIASQKKRILRSAREHDQNRRLTSSVKTHFHRLEQVVAEGDAPSVDAEHRRLVSQIDKAVQRGALHS